MGDGDRSQAQTGSDDNGESEETAEAGCSHAAEQSGGGGEWEGEGPALHGTGLGKRGQGCTETEVSGYSMTGPMSCLGD